MIDDISYISPEDLREICELVDSKCAADDIYPYYDYSRKQIREAVRAIKAAKETPKVVEKETDKAKLWKNYEKLNEQHVEKAPEGDVFSVDFKTKRPIAISFISDQHIDGHSPCDMKRMREDAEYIQATDGMFACLMGDGVNNHIKHRSAVITAKTTPQEQYKLYDYYLSLFHEKIVVMCSGNHDLWTESASGIDMVQILAENNKVKYAKSSAIINANVGSIPYTLAFRHQYRTGSALNQTHAVKQWLRTGDTEFDIGAIGHEHEPAIESFMYRGLERWVCRPGSYQLTSQYAQVFGYNVSTPTCPTFVLYPNQREIIGFTDVYRAGEFLKHARI